MGVMMRSYALALDRSMRSVDQDGVMTVTESKISKAAVNGYMGREVPNWQALGLDPDRIYRLFRDPEELAKGASTFDGKPLLLRHVPITSEVPNVSLWVGTLGKCSFEAPFLITRPLTVITAEAQRLIESDQQRQLSAGYRYVAEMVPGVYGGQHFDGRMTRITGNHVALVADGRAGPDVHVADELPPAIRKFNARKPTMSAHLYNKLFQRGPGDPGYAFDAMSPERAVSCIRKALATLRDDDGDSDIAALHLEEALEALGQAEEAAEDETATSGTEETSIGRQARWGQLRASRGGGQPSPRTGLGQTAERSVISTTDRRGKPDHRQDFASRAADSAIGGFDVYALLQQR